MFSDFLKFLLQNQVVTCIDETGPNKVTVITENTAFVSPRDTYSLLGLLKENNVITSLNIRPEAIIIVHNSRRLVFPDLFLVPIHTEDKRAWYIDTAEFYCDIEIKNSVVSVYVRDRISGNDCYADTKPLAWLIEDINMVTTSEKEMQRWVDNGRSVKPLGIIDNAKERLLTALMNLADPALVSKGGANMDKRFLEARELIKELKAK